MSGPSSAVGLVALARHAGADEAGAGDQDEHVGDLVAIAGDEIRCVRRERDAGAGPAQRGLLEAPVGGLAVRAGGHALDGARAPVVDEDVGDLAVLVGCDEVRGPRRERDAARVGDSDGRSRRRPGRRSRRGEPGRCAAAKGRPGHRRGPEQPDGQGGDQRQPPNPTCSPTGWTRDQLYRRAPCVIRPLQEIVPELPLYPR